MSSESLNEDRAPSRQGDQGQHDRRRSRGPAAGRRHALLLGTAVCGLIAAASPASRAQQVPSTWQGRNSLSYTDPANWTAGVPLTAGQVGVFVTGGTATVNLNDGTAAAPDGLTFNGTTAYTITISNGSALRLGATGLVNGSSVAQTIALAGGTLSLPGTATGANTVVTLAAGATDAIEGGVYAGTIAGGGDLTKTTAGRLVLTGTDSATGATVVTAGTLDVAGSISQSAALRNAGTVVVEANAAATFTGAVTNAGTLTSGGALAAASITNQAGATLTSTGTLSANTLANAGTANLAGTLNQVAVTNTGTVAVTGALGGTSNLVNAAGASVGIGPNSYTGLGTLTNGGTVTVGTGTLAATTVTNQAGASLVSGGTVTAVSIANAGALQLSGTLTTPSLVNSGTLAVTGALGGSSNVTNTGGGTIAVGANSFSGIGTLTNGASVTIGSGSLSAQTIANQAGATLTGAGSLAVGTLGNAGAVNLAGRLTAAVVNNAATFTVTGALGGSTTAFNNAAGATLAVGDNSYTGVGTLTNAGSVTIGQGALSATVINGAAGSILTSAGSLTAATVNNAGTAALAGTLAAGTVNNTGAVTVTGALGGSTTAFNNAAGATLAVGDNSYTGLGTLTNQGQVTVGAGSLAAATIANLGGTLTSAGTLTAGTLTNTGAATVSGTLNATTVNNTGSFKVSGPLAGTLGTFNQQQGTFDVGGNTATMGTLSLTGGSVVDGTVQAGLFALQAGTVGASLSGPGSLTKTGPGTVTLSGVDPYTGATVVSGGRLVLVGSGAIAASSGVRDDAVLDIAGTTGGASIRSLSGSGEVVLGGQTLTLTAAADTFAGRITGTGGLTLTAGREVLAGPSTYAGGTLVEGGTLGLGDAGAIGTGTLRLGRGTTLEFAADQLDIANATVLTGRGDHRIDTGEFTATLSGTISGPGHLTKTGTGQLTLEARNGYGGGTTVSAGTLVGSAASFGSGAIQDDAALVIQQATDAGFSNAIAGAGTLTKRGAGALDLTGQSSLSGPTEVQGGTLVVDGGLAASVVTLDRGTLLAGTGTVGGIVAKSGSVVQPGLRTTFATLNATGPVSFAAGSTLRVDIDARGGNDRVATTGAATLAGGTVDVLASAGVYNPAARYTLLTARQGVSGRFSDLTTTTNLVFLQPFLIYNPGAVILAFAQQPFVSAARTTNDATTAGALQSLGPSAFLFIASSTNNSPGNGNIAAPGYNAATLYYALLGQTQAGAAQALAALSGEAHASAVTAAFEDNRFVREAILNRLQDEADAATRPGAATAPAKSPYGAWGQAFGDFGRNGGRGAATLDRSLGGFVFGIDGPLPSALGPAFGPWSLGIAGGYTSDAIGVSQRASSGTVETFTAGLYAGARYGALDLRLGSVAGGIRTDLGRTIAFPGFLDAARSSTGGTIVQGFGEAGYRVAIGRSVLEPLLTAAAIHIDQDAFTEKGGPAALVGAARGYDLQTTTLGLRSEQALWGEIPVFAHAFLGWRHAFGDVRPGTLASFASGSTAFTVEGVPVARDALSVQAGIDWKPFSGVTLAGLYSGQVGARAEDHAVKAQIDYRF